MGHSLFVVDVFTNQKYTGNQLAVVFHDGQLSPESMQKIARETNYSETTFVQEPRLADGSWAVRIFTPNEELPFAGHPTLGTAWVLREFADPSRPSHVVLQLKCGATPVRFDAATATGWLTAPNPEFGERLDAASYAPVAGLDPADLHPALPAVAITIGPTFAFLPLRNVEALSRACFRLERFESLVDVNPPRALFLFAGDSASGFRARMLATPMGITEDPATGSANAALAAYLLRYDRPTDGQLNVRVEQGVEMGRPSVLLLAATRCANSARIEVGGQVVLTMRGEIV